MGVDSKELNKSVYTWHSCAYIAFDGCVTRSRRRRVVDIGGENLNSLFDELAEFEAQLKPFTDDILAESAPQPVSAGGLKL